MATSSDQPPLSWEVAASVGLHLALFGGLAISQVFAPNAPLFDPQDVMIVSAVALPKSAGPMPDKAMRAPDPAAGTPKADAPPPPPTASDMVLKDPNADAPKGDDVARPAEPAKVDNTKRREDLLRDLTAPVGTRDQVATSPDGVDWDAFVAGAAAGAAADPVLARWYAAARAKVIPNWTPLPATVAAHPNYEVILRVEVSATGAVSNPEIKKSSGDPSFDRSALLALHKTGAFPPPPESYRESVARGMYVRLAASDLR